MAPSQPLQPPQQPANMSSSRSLGRQRLACGPANRKPLRCPQRVQCKGAALQQQRLPGSTAGKTVSSRTLQRNDAQPLSLPEWDLVRVKKIRQVAGENKIVPFRRRLRTGEGLRTLDMF